MPDRLFDMGQKVIVSPLPLFDTHAEYVGTICDYRHTGQTWVYEIEQPNGKIERSVAQNRLEPLDA